MTETKTSKNMQSAFLEYMHHAHLYLKSINDSKIFAGLVVITLNIASKFVTIKLSKSMESYLRHTFSRDALIFCIVWMGSREIYIAFCVTLMFILFMDFLLNDDSQWCILPESFKDYHISLLDSAPSPDDIRNAQQLLERAGVSTKVDPSNPSADATGTGTTSSPLLDSNSFPMIKW